MIKISSIFGLGIVIALIPLSGFPLYWKNFLYMLSGILIATFSLLIRKELNEVLKRLHTDVVTNTFAESAPKEEIAGENKLF